jgi:hypothetical protein
MRAVLLVIAIGLLVYLFNQDGAFQNEGELELPVGTDSDNEVKTRKTRTTPSYHIDPEGVPSYHSQTKEGALATRPPPSTKKVDNPQVDDELNPIPQTEQPDRMKQVRFAHIAECPDMNIVKHNKSVLPLPQYSNNYTPLNSHGGRAEGQGHSGISANPQEIDKLKASCQPHLSCYPKDTVTAGELLPRDDPYNMWSQVNPDTPGHLADKNFLESGHHFGINTVGTSLRNANYQLRSDPPIPQIPIGPWYQSTIDPDTNRRAFEIGSDY